MKNINYEVWALGYDKEQNCTDLDLFLGEFKTADDAITFVDKYNSFSDIQADMRAAQYVDLHDTVTLDIVVETVEDDSVEIVNIETIYSKSISIN